jgi:stage II sporulation protein D
MGIKSAISAACVLFCSFEASAHAGTTRISILSILHPSRIQISVHDEEIATLDLLNESVTISEPLSENSILKIQAKQNQLFIEGYPDRVRKAGIRCPKAPCRLLLEVDEKIQRWYEGDLEVTQYNNTINIVLLIGTETLLSSVVASESGEFRQVEALRAFAVLARTFLQSPPRHPEIGADVCDTTHCQVYRAISPSKLIQEAVRSTEGLVLTFNQKVFHPFYSRSCGGKTFTFEEVWQQEAPDYPFFSVECPACKKEAQVHWRTGITLDSLRLATGLPISDIQRSGGWIEVSRLGSVSKFSPENFRILLGREMGWNILPGNQFQVKRNQKSIVFEGTGYGHGVGLCQTGGESLARKGKNFQQILAIYFPNTEIRGKKK